MVNFSKIERGYEMEEILTISNLTKSYGNKEILKGIDLHASRGEIIGYIGPNGAGKSTTVKIILGLEGDYGGDIRLFGESIKENQLAYKRRIGMCQKSLMFMII